MSAQENTSAGRDKLIRQLWLINLLLLLFCLYLLISNTPAPFNKPPLVIFLLAIAIVVCCLLSVECAGVASASSAVGLASG